MNIKHCYASILYLSSVLLGTFMPVYGSRKTTKKRGKSVANMFQAQSNNSNGKDVNVEISNGDAQRLKMNVLLTENAEYQKAINELKDSIYKLKETIDTQKDIIEEYESMIKIQQEKLALFSNNIPRKSASPQPQNDDLSFIKQTKNLLKEKEDAIEELAEQNASLRVKCQQFASAQNGLQNTIKSLEFEIKTLKEVKTNSKSLARKSKQKEETQIQALQDQIGSLKQEIAAQYEQIAELANAQYKDLDNKWDLDETPPLDRQKTTRSILSSRPRSTRAKSRRGSVANENFAEIFLTNNSGRGLVPLEDQDEYSDGETILGGEPPSQSGDLLSKATKKKRKSSYSSLVTVFLLCSLYINVYLFLTRRGGAKKNKALTRKGKRDMYKPKHI